MGIFGASLAFPTCLEMKHSARRERRDMALGRIFIAFLLAVTKFLIVTPYEGLRLAHGSGDSEDTVAGGSVYGCRLLCLCGAGSKASGLEVGPGSKLLSSAPVVV